MFLCAEGIAIPASRTNVSYSCILVFPPKKEDEETRRQENKTIVMLAGDKSSAYKSNVLYSRIPVFLYSPKK